jgi:hypothetical protein
MKLLCVTDLHGNAAALRRILDAAGPVDLVLLGGDLTTFGAPDDAEALVAQAGKAGCPVLAVAGNCDSAAIDRRLKKTGAGLHGRGVVAGELGIHGLSAIPPWRDGMYQFTEQELAEALRRGHAEVSGAGRHVVLAHAPPRNGSLDRTALGQHVGSVALMEFIERVQPDLVVCGHVHEARGVEKLGKTRVVNCGPAASGFYAVAEAGEGIAVELRRA